MSRLTVALAFPALLLGACAQEDVDYDELGFRNGNQDSDITIHEGDNTDNPECIIWDIKDSCAHEADETGVQAFLNLNIGDDLVDREGNVLCSIDGHDLVRAEDGAVLLTLHGNRLEDTDGDTLYSYGAEHIYTAHISDRYASFTATDNLSKGTTARKLQIGTLLLDIDDCIDNDPSHRHPD